MKEKLLECLKKEGVWDLETKESLAGTAIRFSSIYGDGKMFVTTSPKCTKVEYFLPGAAKIMAYRLKKKPTLTVSYWQDTTKIKVSYWVSKEDPELIESTDEIEKVLEEKFNLKRNRVEGKRIIFSVDGQDAFEITNGMISVVNEDVKLNTIVKHIMDGWIEGKYNFFISNYGEICKG